MNGARATYSGTIPPLSLISLVDLQTLIWKINWWANTINLEEPWKSPQADYLDSMTARQFARKVIAPL